MKARNIDKFIEDSKCIQGGTKEACLKTREILSKGVVRKDNFYASHSEVSMEEFLQAVKVLVAFASNLPDEKVELYYCQGDCARYYDKHCVGELTLSSCATKLCPHYTQEDK